MDAKYSGEGEGRGRGISRLEVAVRVWGCESGCSIARAAPAEVQEQVSANVTMADSIQSKWLKKRKLPADLAPPPAASLIQVVMCMVT